jgi:pimeloyl-ACP methyl ester carboxylesterase
LLFVHGGMAHADWWSFIAPYFADTHRVAAVSLSGMGRSAWREAYDTEQFAEELMAACWVGGLMDGAVKPVIVGHSFGGLPTLCAGVKHAAHLAGVIALDSPLFSPEQRKARADRRPPSKPPRETRLYASEIEALMRFRYQPPQNAGNDYITDHIARHSLRQVTTADGATGWTWRFDPFLWSRLKRRDASVDLPKVATRLAVMWGGTSALYDQEVIAYVRGAAPAGTTFVEIPEAAHHVMVDQPIALVSALRAVQAGWASDRR